MKLKKKQRRIIFIILLLIIILIVLYFLNIFGLKNILTGTTTQKITEGDSTITTINGNDMSLPNEFYDYNLNILENDKIIKYNKNEENSTTKVISSITVSTDKSVDEVFEQYSKLFSNSMSHTVNDNTKIIITGDAQNLIKIEISPNQYIISIEKR